MGMQFLQKLTEAIVKNGGYPEMLHTLCTTHPEADKSLDQIGKLIAVGKWPVPRSLLERLAYERTTSGGIHVHESAEEDRIWNWCCHIDLPGEFGIPVTKFGTDDKSTPPPPEEIFRQLVGRRLTRSMEIMWKGEPHVFVACELGNEGEVIQIDRSRWHLYFIAIAPASRFDFDR